MKTDFALKGWHVLMILAAFFGAVIAVNAIFITLAIGSFPGEDVRRSYLQGLQYNDTLAERRSQAARGWQARAVLLSAADGAVLEVVLLRRDGGPVRDATIAGELQWPTSAARDRALTFEAVGDGRYRAALGDLTEGHWRLRARAEHEEGALDLESELTWPTPR